MNKKGKEKLNNEAVYNILSHATQLNDGSFIFTDLSNTTFLVDNDGYMYKIIDDKIVHCNTGATSSKKNGYVYADLTVSIDKQLETIEYAQHSIVCALFNGLSGLLDSECNHMDNCPFNNHPSNLEWTTHALNVLHGRIVRCTADVHYNEHSLVWTGYDLYVQRSNLKYTFDCLKVAISCQDIRAYEQYVLTNNKRVKSLKQYWGLTDKTSILSLYKYDEFIKWWAKRNSVSLKQYKHTQTV